MKKKTKLVSSDTLTPQGEAPSGIQADTERLTFLDKNDGDITFHEGDVECGYYPGWEVRVTINGNVLSGAGHSIREAIDAARDLSPRLYQHQRVREKTKMKTKPEQHTSFGQKWAVDRTMSGSRGRLIIPDRIPIVHWENGDIDLDAIAEAANASLGVETPPTMELQPNETGLLPCPFCGSDARFGDDGDGGIFVECSNPLCASSSQLKYPMGKDSAREELIEQWNRRTPLTSSASQTATDARENEQEKVSPWIRTAERAPCKEDGDDHNHVLAWKDYMGVQQIHYSFVAENGWPFWMPIPPVPEGKNEPS